MEARLMADAPNDMPNSFEDPPQQELQEQHELQEPQELQEQQVEQNEVQRVEVQNTEDSKEVSQPTDEKQNPGTGLNAAIDWSFLVLDESPCVFPDSPENLSRIVSTKLNSLARKNILTVQDISAATLKTLATRPVSFAVEVLENLEFSVPESIQDKNSFIAKGFAKICAIKSQLPPAKDVAVNNLLAKTGCSLMIGGSYRHYAGPPPNWNKNLPDPRQCQVLFTFRNYRIYIYIYNIYIYIYMTIYVYMCVRI
jgi:hypothetical protein